MSDLKPSQSQFNTDYLIDIKTFKKLCREADSLLMSAPARKTRYAIPWLHVNRLHPGLTNTYSGLFRRFKEQLLSKLCNAALSIAKTYYCALFQTRKLWAVASPFTDSPDILIVSHIVNTGQRSFSNDIYFGCIAEELSSMGLNVGFVLLNHTNKRCQAIASEWTIRNTPCYILSNTLGLFEESTLIAKSLVEAFRLLMLSVKSRNTFRRKLCALSALEALSAGTTSAMRITRQIELLVSQLHPRALLITYEGHSWERTVFSAARSVSPSIRCIGYQHAILSNVQHSFNRLLHNQYDPDVILTSGHISYSSLLNNQALRNIEIYNLGSVRAVSKARQMRIVQSSCCCLILPEGMIQEATLLFAYSLQCALLMPHVKFIWRLHPSLSWDQLFQTSCILKDLPSNITRSVNSLEADLEIANFALYRGSSSIVQAVCSGVFPIYLSIANEWPIDILHSISSLRPCVSMPSELADLFSNQQKLGETFSLVQAHCMKLYSPLNSSVLHQCLDNQLDQTPL